MDIASKWNAGSLIGTSSAYWRGCALQAAVRLKIFSVLGREKKSCAEIALAIDADVRATEYLLNALAAMELLHKSAETYQNSNESYTFLAENSDQYIGHIILHHHHLLDGWGQLDQAVRQGTPVEQRSYGEDIERESFIMGMFNLAMITAPRAAAAVSLEGRTRLLDLGGGPGTYAIHFCRANPGLRAVVFDRPTTEPFLRRTVATCRLSDRIDFIAGDFNRDGLGCQEYDVAWLSHILHSNGPEACRELLVKAHRALKPGGIILIHDFILSDSKDSPEFAALFSLNMLINNDEGRCYSGGEIREMLSAAGFFDMRLIDPQAPNRSLIIAAAS